MNIQAINSTSFLQNNSALNELKPQEGLSFTQLVSQHILDTNHQLNAADKALHDLASGHTENLHQTMITLEQAKLSFQYLEQIRNRLMSAYHDLLREQI